VRDCQRDRDGTPKQSEIHHQHSIPVYAVIFIFRLGTHTHTQKVMAMMMMGREYTTRRASRLIVFHQKKERKKEEEEDES
jgi:hypothetical protein